MALVHEQLSEQFFRWEERGRGWQVYAEPVRPEPPFRPYYGNFLPFTQVPDSGLKPRIWNQLFSRLFEKPKPAPPPPPEETEPEPTLLVREPLVELQVLLPADLDIARESFEQFFRNLGQCHEPVAFELLGTAKRVLAQFAASVADVPIVRRQLAAHFPDVEFRQKIGTLERPGGMASGTRRVRWNSAWNVNSCIRWRPASLIRSSASSRRWPNCSLVNSPCFKCSCRARTRNGRKAFGVP